MKRLVVRALGFQPAYVQEITNALAAEGLQVTLLAGAAQKRSAWHPNVTLLDVEGGEASGGPFLSKLGRLLGRTARSVAAVRRAGIPTVYHAGTDRPLIGGVVTYGLLKAMGFRVVHTVHNVLPHGRTGRMNRALHRLIYRHTTDVLVVHTRHIAARLQGEYGVRADKIVVAEHGTYHAPADPALTRETARAALGIDRQDCLVLLFGLQRPYKGTHFLLEALEPRRCEGLRVAIRGWAEPGYLERLRAIVRERRLEERVDLVAGFVPDGEAERLFKAADLVALPYLEDDSQSGVLFLAYAYGRPVLAADQGNFRDYVLPGRTGELFTPRDAAALRSALERMRQDRERYEERFIREWAHERFSWARAAAAIRLHLERKGYLHE